MATDEVPRLVAQLPAPSKSVIGDVTVGDQCLTLHHPNRQGLLADLRKIAESVACERRASERYDETSGVGDNDVEGLARMDSLDSCFSSYDSGELAGVSRELVFGLGAAGEKCSVVCEESLEQRYKTVSGYGTAEYSESETDSNSEDSEESRECLLAEGRGGDGDATDGEEQSTDEVIQSLSSMLHREANQRFESLSVTDSEAVHVGNVTYILGELNVKQVVQETSLRQQVFLSQEIAGEGLALPPSGLSIIPRGEWLALPPSEPAIKVTPPVNLVFINHTATDSSPKMTTNMMLCRRIQQLHMEGNEWDDIAYNFLVGMDGYVYEGRGWGLKGAHTYGYNSRSLGVAFIGCFMQHVPTPQAIAAFDQLIELGVREGHLTPDCRVMANCQCTPSESPGRAFFLLIRTWSRWTETPPPPPPLDSATKQLARVDVACETPNGTSRYERDSTAEEQNTSAVLDFRDGTSGPLPPCGELHPMETADKCKDSWVSPDEQSKVLQTETITGGCEEANTQTVHSQSVAVAMSQGGHLTTAPSGDYEEILTERSSESREAVSVSSSSNVHLGSVNYVLGPLSVSHVLRRSTVERTVTGTRPDTGLQKLDLVSREQWLACPPAEPIPKLECPVRTVVICHTATKEPTSVESERRQVRILQEFAVHCRGRSDLPFNFLVGPSGAVYEARGWELAADLSPCLRMDLEPDLELGAPDDGGRCLTVALVGTFSKRLPSPVALYALHSLVAEAQRRGVVAQDYRLVGHCQLADTSSPGEELFSLLKTWPRWSGRLFDDRDRDTHESDTVPVR